MFAIVGLFRGSVRQLFGVVGFLGGLWVAVLLSRWVGARWEGARPAVVFWVLRWLVAAVAALVVAAVFHAWGGLLRKSVQAGPAGALDRVLGAPLGAAIGLAWAVALITLTLLAPRSLGIRSVLLRARTPRALVTLGARTCDAVEGRVPVLHGLGRWLHEAERRARVQSRSS